MSKFTKALEKIQNDKDTITKEELKAAAKPTFFEIPREFQKEAEESWDRGVRTVRHIKPDTRLVTYHFPNSLLSEQYRMLRTNLKNQLTEKQAKVLLVSSSVRGEGKTVTATNLAMTLAEMESAKVVLVDADLRRGKVAEYMGFEKSLPGLSNYLSNGTAIKDVMVRNSNSVHNLVIIPRGEIMKNPAELVGSQKFRVLIAELRSRFDYVIIDSPPIMSVADAGILGKEVDGLVMVIQAGKTPKSVISHAHVLFQQAGLPMMGYVLTNVEFHSSDYRYYYSYYSDYDENAGLHDRSTLHGRFQFFLKKWGFNLERSEERFNQWWEKKSSKSKHSLAERDLKKRSRETPAPASEVPVPAAKKED